MISATRKPPNESISAPAAYDAAVLPDTTATPSPSSTAVRRAQRASGPNGVGGANGASAAWLRRGAASFAAAATRRIAPAAPRTSIESTART